MAGPMTAIWALIGHGDWKAKAVHWDNLDYPAEKNKSGTQNVRQPPNYIGDICAPDGKPIPKATVEGKLLKIDFKPWSGDQTVFHTFNFIIDPLAEKGPQKRPDYGQRELARLAGWASHVDKKTNVEVVKPIYRDNFVSWGHFEDRQHNKTYEVWPMYFIPHGKAIVNFTEPRDDYRTFNKGKPSEPYALTPLVEGSDGPESSDATGGEDVSSADGGFTMATEQEETDAAKEDFSKDEEQFLADRAAEAEKVDTEEKGDSF